HIQRAVNIGYPGRTRSAQFIVLLRLREIGEDISTGWGTREQSERVRTLHNQPPKILQRSCHGRNIRQDLGASEPVAAMRQRRTETSEQRSRRDTFSSLSDSGCGWPRR